MHIPFATNCSYPVRPGNRVRQLIDGEPAFQRICEAVEPARHSVWVTVAFALYRERARANAAKRANGKTLDGLAFAMEPRIYAT